MDLVLITVCFTPPEPVPVPVPSLVVSTVCCPSSLCRLTAAAEGAGVAADGFTSSTRVSRLILLSTCPVAVAEAVSCGI